ncbi:MAG: hypothetical protein QG641_2343 [Candidatus Poribacteria bacterium]|nr:hypothetical protein [Candidatus Poribacteria bacterium]
MLILRAINSIPSRIVRIEVDFDELRQYIKRVFEEEFGEGIVVDVEARKPGPNPIGVTVYVQEKKDGMWDLCLDIADAFRNQGIQVGIHTELAKEVLNEVQ